VDGLMRASTMRLVALSFALPASLLAGAASANEIVGKGASQIRKSAGQGAYADLVAKHAASHGLPASLVHRVILRESRYNAGAVSKGNYGLMQIRLGTARAMGYRGDAAGLLDADTNMTYAVKYLAGAYRAAGGNADRAVALYQRGYYGVTPRRPAQAAAATSTGTVGTAGEGTAARRIHLSRDDEGR
jgi:soluble lytic murein transglycosylase-like protein